MGNKRTKDLSGIVGSQTLVEIDRSPMDPYKITGYVVGLSEKLILLHLVQDQAMRLNGYVCVRRSDVKSIRVYSGEKDFMSRVLPLLGANPAPRPDLDIASIFSLLFSAGSRFSVLGIENEKADPNAVFIGAVENLTSKIVVLRQIDTAGHWMQPSEFWLKDITKVVLGDGYQEALALLVRHESEPDT